MTKYHTQIYVKDNKNIVSFLSLDKKVKTLDDIFQYLVYNGNINCSHEYARKNDILFFFNFVNMWKRNGINLLYYINCDDNGVITMIFRTDKLCWYYYILYPDVITRQYNFIGDFSYNADDFIDFLNCNNITNNSDGILINNNLSDTNLSRSLDNSLDSVHSIENVDENYVYYSSDEDACDNSDYNNIQETNSENLNYDDYEQIINNNIDLQNNDTEQNTIIFMIF